MVKHSKPPNVKSSEWKGRKKGGFDGAREGLISKELRFKFFFFFFFPSKLCTSTSIYELALANKSKM